jgi:predicted porin
MNKKLLTAAIGAALAAAPMFAANAAPTVYGKFNVGVAMIDNGNDKVGDQDSSTIAMTDDASRIGVKGEEDLGGGMKALYMWEIGVDVDNPGDNSGTTGTGGIGLSNRDTYVGLGGGWGSLRLGQYNTAYKLVSVPTEIFGDTIGDFTANGFSGETRQANNIGYTSPSFGGIQFALEYATANETGDTGTGGNGERNPLNGSISWSSGPLYLAFGYYDYDLLAANGLESAMKVSAQFKSGALRVAATYEDEKSKGTTVVIDTMNVAGSFAFGNHELGLSYSMYGADSDTGTTTDLDCTMIAAGYFYNFSKATALKVVYNMIDNDTNATCFGRMGATTASVQGLPNPTAGKDPSGLQVQISSSF